MAELRLNSYWRYFLSSRFEVIETLVLKFVQTVLTSFSQNTLLPKTISALFGKIWAHLIHFCHFINSIFLLTLKQFLLKMTINFLFWFLLSFNTFVNVNLTIVLSLQSILNLVLSSQGSDPLIFKINQCKMILQCRLLDLIVFLPLSSLSFSLQLFLVIQIVLVFQRSLNQPNIGQSFYFRIHIILFYLFIEVNLISRTFWVRDNFYFVWFIFKV